MLMYVGILAAEVGLGGHMGTLFGIVGMGKEDLIKGPLHGFRI